MLVVFSSNLDTLSLMKYRGKLRSRSPFAMTRRSHSGHIHIYNFLIDLLPPDFLRSSSAFSPGSSMLAISLKVLLSSRRYACPNNRNILVVYDKLNLKLKSTPHVDFVKVASDDASLVSLFTSFHSLLRDKKCHIPTDISNYCFLGELIDATGSFCSHYVI